MLVSAGQHHRQTYSVSSVPQMTVICGHSGLPQLCGGASTAANTCRCIPLQHPCNRRPWPGLSAADRCAARLPRRRPSSATAAAAVEDGAAGAPMVTLQFDLPEGSRTITCESGDILRDVMLTEKVDLYTTWGKVANCGGGGQCGTCIVEVLADPEGVLGSRNDTEMKKLKKKPDNYRLACQTNTGDGEVGGQGVILRAKPK